MICRSESAGSEILMGGLIDTIKHIVMWKLKPFAEGKEKSSNAVIIKESLVHLVKEIPQIKLIEVGLNINDTNQSYDVVLYSIFDNLVDLGIYQNHPSHIKISEFITKIRDERIVVDYES